MWFQDSAFKIPVGQLKHFMAKLAWARFRSHSVSFSCGYFLIYILLMPARRPAKNIGVKTGCHRAKEEHRRQRSTCFSVAATSVVLRYPCCGQCVLLSIPVWGIIFFPTRTGKTALQIAAAHRNRLWASILCPWPHLSHPPGSSHPPHAWKSDSMKNRTGPETSGQPDLLACEPSSLQGDARLGLLHLGVVFDLWRPRACPLPVFKASASLSYHMTEKLVLMACNIPVKRALCMILYFLIHFNLQVGI